MLKITEDVYWVGALDPNLRVFDIIMKAERGTTYNSYLVRGQEKTALIEAVKSGFLEDLLNNLNDLCAPEDLDYIILNHHEPDHTGALKELLKKAVNAQVVVSITGKRFLQGILNEDINPLQVKDGDFIDLGGKTLEFIHAPFLHWPDTMFTYLKEDNILFSCDSFGCHYADPKMFDDQVDDFSHAYRYYYDHIVRPFKEYVLKGGAKLEGKDLKIICPSHGPILRTNPRQYVDKYMEWSVVPSLERPILAIYYLSSYGNTAKMAESVAAGARAVGVTVELMDITGVEIGKMMDLVEKAAGIAIGSPTINGDAIKPVWDLLSSLATIKLKGKVAAAFGSYGWSGEAVPMICERLKSLRFKVVEAGVKAHLVVDDADLQNCYEYGQLIAQRIFEEVA